MISLQKWFLAYPPEISSFLLQTTVTPSPGIIDSILERSLALAIALLVLGFALRDAQVRYKALSERLQTMEDAYRAEIRELNADYRRELAAKDGKLFDLSLTTQKTISELTTIIRDSESRTRERDQQLLGLVSTIDRTISQIQISRTEPPRQS